MQIQTDNFQNNTVATGITLASWVDGKQVSTAVAFVLQGNNGSWTTIPADQYNLDRVNGRVVKEIRDDSGTAVNWSAYTAYRATYALYDPATYGTTTYPTETQTYDVLEFVPAPFDPATGVVNASVVLGLVVTAQQFADTIQSDNFSSGSAGWQITRAGVAELQQVTVRGTVYASAGEFTGVVTIGTSGGIFQGTGSFGSPTTALKIYNSGGVGLVEMWGSGVKQVYFNSSGELAAGGGDVILNSLGVKILVGTGNTNKIKFANASNLSGGEIYGTYSAATGSLKLGANPSGNATAGVLDLWAQNSNSDTLQLQLNNQTSSSAYAMFYPTGAQVFLGLGITNIASGGYTPAALLHLKSTAPTFRMEDSTASAKGLLITVDANLATFEEIGGTDVMVLDLANARVGLGTASPAVRLDVNGAVNIGGTLTLSAQNIASDTTTGMQLLTSSTQKLGVWGATPIVRPGAYTQTYATADRTHDTPTFATLTDNSGGTANNTVQSIGATYAQSEVANNFADVVRAINRLGVDHLDLAQLVNSLLDDQQAIGFAS